MNKFEQLIEYVINNEEDKARALFHEVVVEKSRSIYEEMMNDELGGDGVGDLMTDVEADEEGFDDEGEADEFDSVGGDDFDDEGEDDEFDSVGGDEFDIESDSELDDDAEDLEDRVVDIEDKLDELMAEFEALMDDNSEDDVEDSDDDEGFDTDEDDEDFDTDEDDEDPVNEAISLKAAPKATNSEEGNTNRRSVVAANSGARGASAKPVTATGTEAKGRTVPTAKELVGRVGNTPAQSTQKPTPAKKPAAKTGTGVNTKSVIQ